MRDRGSYRLEDLHDHKQRCALCGEDGAAGRPWLQGDLGACWGSAGLALALDRDKLSDLRGVLTPAATMGDVLLTRLPAAGVSLGTERLD